MYYRSKPAKTGFTNDVNVIVQIFETIFNRYVSVIVLSALNKYDYIAINGDPTITQILYRCYEVDNPVFIL